MASLNTNKIAASMASSSTAPVAGIASLNIYPAGAKKIVASRASFLIAPVAGMASLNSNKVVASMASSSTAPAAGMVSLNNRVQEQMVAGMVIGRLPHDFGKDQNQIRWAVNCKSASDATRGLALYPACDPIS